jgi:uncharacterized protein YbaR (Trm112 family)
MSPFNLLDSHRSEYLKRIQKWAKRLRSDIKESSKISQEVKLLLKYPGTEELPYFVKAGIDILQNIKEGIPPTPSQAQNIEEFEYYSGVLSIFYLCIQEELRLSQKSMLIEGKVIPELLIYYSRLWLNKALRLMGQKEEFVERDPLEILTCPLPRKPLLLKRAQGKLSEIDIFPSGKPRPCGRWVAESIHNSRLINKSYWNGSFQFK